jgi:hypothetical protein
MYCYRFPDRATFLATCDAFGWLSEPSEESPEATLIAYTSDRAIDEIGSIVTTGGEYDEETGKELVPPVTDEGHHINYRGVHPIEWDDYIVVPESPRRIFAGVSGALDPYAEPEEALEI